ncbi:type VI secretion system baseplate subunit TssK [Robbsia andropogonis]|uniref:type VI secretion system baseplate subunit TssK n=1 Tax=Robbsia andropogonis TaxID=28092 RepID=UPI002A6ACD52|nr:type VI secretion system baseplate subunit TssK [Robbsia andropogonis]
MHDEQEFEGTHERVERISERVEWHEGMLLSPQHFQLLDARLEQLVRWHLLRTNPYAWGVWSCHFERMQFASGHIRVTTLEAVMPDGTVLTYDATDSLNAPLELDLRHHAALLSGAEVDLYLTLPSIHTMRGSGVQGDPQDRPVRRFCSVAGPLVMDAVSGSDAIAVPRQVPQLGLAVGAIPDASYDVLRIGTLRRNADVVTLAERLPPSLRLRDQGRILVRVRGIAVQMRAKALFLARQLLSSGPMGQDVPATIHPEWIDSKDANKAPLHRSSDDGGLARFAMREKLRCLTLALPQLEAVLQTQNVHPHALFVALASVRGAVALLREDMVPGLLDRYDHNNPEGALSPLLDDIDLAMQKVSLRYRERSFVFTEGRYEALLQQDLRDICFIVAQGGSTQALEAWMAGAVIGRKADLPTLVSRRVLGLARERVNGAAARIGGDGENSVVFRIDARNAPLRAGTPLVVYSPRGPGQALCNPTLVLLEDTDVRSEEAPAGGAAAVYGAGRDESKQRAETMRPVDPYWRANGEDGTPL